MDLSDILSSVFGRAMGGGGFGFDSFFGGGQQRADPNAPQRGADLSMELEIDFEEALFGSKRNLDLTIPKQCATCGGTGAAKGTHRVKCPTCGGRGAVVRGNGFFQVRQQCPKCGGEGSVIEHPCPDCGGSGQRRARAEVTLSIPKGVDTGSRLRLTGKGGGGLRGGEPGDLYVVTRVRDSSIFLRDGLDLMVEMPISPVVAAVGGTVDVPTPDGMAELRIAAGTPNGKSFRLRGKGMPSLRGLGTGDLVVRLVFEVPQRLTAKQRGMFDDLAKALEPTNFPEQQRLADDAKRFYARKEKLSS